MWYGLCYHFVFAHAVLDGHDGEVGAEAVVELDQFLGGVDLIGYGQIIT